MTIQYFSPVLWRRSLRKTITNPVVLIWAFLLVGLVVALIVGVEPGPGDSVVVFGNPAGGFDLLARATIPLALRLPLGFFIPITSAFLSVELLRHSTVHYVVTAPIRRRAIIHSTWLGAAAAYFAVVGLFGVLVAAVAWAKGLSLPGAALAGVVVGFEAGAIHAFVLFCTIASGNAGLGAAAGVAWVGMLGPMLVARGTSSMLASVVQFILPPASGLSRHLDAVLGANPEVPWLLVLHSCSASVVAMAAAAWVYGRKQF